VFFAEGTLKRLATPVETLDHQVLPLLLHHGTDDIDFDVFLCVWLPPLRRVSSASICPQFQRLCFFCVWCASWQVCARATQKRSPTKLFSIIFNL
jgi:hypothetical protein